MVASWWCWLAAGAGLGAALVVAAALLALAWLARAPPDAKPAQSLKCTLPQAVVRELTRGADAGSCEGALNAALQFMFQQSTADTRWLRRRLATELAELLARAPSGRLFESLTLRSLDVGTEFPSIKNLRLVSGELEEDGARLRSLDLSLEMAYDGSFKIDVDAVMLLGKVANISITVESVSGPVRLLFRRAPYTHWGVAFEAAPKLELGVRGRFQGRQIKPRLAALVAAHIRRAIAQRHTMPNYKIRYKPFFPKTEPGSAEGEEGPVPSGALSVHLLEVTRLQCSCQDTSTVQVQAVLGVDSHAWVSLRRDVLTLDVTVVPPAGGGGQLGLVCCQTLGAQVAVDTVVPMSPAYRADLRRGDVVLAIDSKPVSTVGQVGKLLRSAEQRAVTVRVRRVTPRRRKSGERPADMTKLGPELKRTKTNSFSFRRVSEVMEGVRLQGMKVAQGKSAAQEPEQLSHKSESGDTESPAKKTPEIKPQKPQEPVVPPIGPGGSFGLRKRRCSVENKHSSDSSAGSTPSTSGSSTPMRQAKDRQKMDIPTIKTDDNPKYYDKLDPQKYESVLGLDPSQAEDPDHARHSQHIEICQLFTTKHVPLKPIITFEDRAEFKLNENHKYLNINVWGTLPGESDDTLLGYLNIPLASLLSECQDSTIGHHLKRYQFLPPDVDIKFSKSHPLASHPGFEPCLCFGDALVWWSWEPGESSPRPPPASTPPPRTAPTKIQHDFVRTHFHRSTQCDFCSKKIWLKDAMQCRSCGLCCHKKCVAECQESSPCAPADVPGTGGRAGCSPPELVTTEPEGAQQDPESDDESARKDSIDALDEGAGAGAMSALVAGLRRAGSAHALCAPRASAAHARSLPPSPSHTPRKQSLEVTEPPQNPFAGCGAAWRDGGGVAAAVRPAASCALSPDALLAAARDSAPGLAQVLSLEQIHSLLCATRETLATQADEGESGRARALAALMLHCCCAAQVAQREAARGENAEPDK